jgi:UDP-N-acetylmuramoyl-tripeptide--D-alanyl-D-alanine ligase
MKRTLQDFALACGGRLHGTDQSYAGVSTDTRTIGTGELFVALHGPNFDGNEFVGAAVAAGAAGAVVDSERRESISQIVVGDTQKAIEAASRRWRAMLTMPVVGVAGSNGKTTVKEMIAAILSQAGNTLATRGNFNNHIGVPLTLFRLEAQHRFAVIEIGTNHLGEVAALVDIAKPTVGIITNAGAEHLEGFGSMETVARAEGEMVEGLDASGTAVINADDEFADLWRGMTRAKVVTFGVRNDADFTASGLRTDVGPQGFVTRFKLTCPAGSTDVELALAGEHNVVNALGAAATAVSAGATLKHVAAGLATMRAVKGRLQFKTAKSGAWIIDDTYNANPSSMRAGIDVLASLEGRKWAVLGDMGELGDFADSSHVEIGEYARAHGVEQLFATGQLMQLTVKSFGANGQWFADWETMAKAIAAQSDAGVRMLIKGSRSNRLERVVAALVGE